MKCRNALQTCVGSGKQIPQLQTMPCFSLLLNKDINAHHWIPQKCKHNVLIYLFI